MLEVLGPGRLVEQLAVGFAQVDGGRWHSPDHARFGRLDRVEGERRDAERAQAITRAQDVAERRRDECARRTRLLCGGGGGQAAEICFF